MDKKIRAEALAERLKLLFQFVWSLREDKELLEDACEAMNDSANFAVSAAPLLGAMGLDYEEEEFESSFRAKRARAILNLLNVLEETENERKEFGETKEAKQKGRAEIMRILGHM